MPVIRVDIASINCVPYLHGLIKTGRGDALAIGRPCHGIYLANIPLIRVDIASSGCIPHLHVLIKTGRGEALAIGRPCYRVYRTSMPTIGIKWMGWVQPPYSSSSCNYCQCTQTTY